MQKTGRWWKSSTKTVAEEDQEEGRREEEVDDGCSPSHPPLDSSGASWSCRKHMFSHYYYDRTSHVKSQIRTSLTSPNCSPKGWELGTAVHPAREAAKLSQHWHDSTGIIRVCPSCLNTCLVVTQGGSGPDIMKAHLCPKVPTWPTPVGARFQLGANHDSSRAKGQNRPLCTTSLKVQSSCVSCSCLLFLKLFCLDVS